jgi:hypothetical protein
MVALPSPLPLDPASDVDENDGVGLVVEKLPGAMDEPLFAVGPAEEVCPGAVEKTKVGADPAVAGSLQPSMKQT